MIIYLSGADTYRSSATLNEMKQKFSTDRDPQGMNLVQLSVGDADDGQIIEQLHAAPFLAEKRMVVLRRLIEDGSKELHALLLDHIQNDTLPNDIILLAWDGEVKPRAKASKALQALLAEQQYSQTFTAPATGKALEGWIAKEVNTRGGMIDRTALRNFAAHSSDDTWEISHSIDQLVAFASGRTITVHDINLFVRPAVDDNIFALVDAAVAGNTQQAFKLMQDQYQSGKDPHYIFAMLLRQYRIMLDIADVLERRLRPDAKAMGLHPFVLKKTTPVVQRLSFDVIKQKYSDLLQVDKKIKTGSGDPAMLVDVFVAGLA